MSGLFEALPSWLGYATTALVGLGAYLQSRRKGDIDESAIVLGKWKELVEQHQSDIKVLKEEFATYKTSSTAEFAAYKAATVAETADLRERLIAAEKRITELETENAGLKRAIAQNSQSTAYQLGRSSKRAGAGETRMSGMQDEITKLDLAGHNLKGTAE